MKIGCADLHSWPHPVHPGIKRAACASAHSFCFSEPNAASLREKRQHSPLRRWIYGTDSGLSLLSSTAGCARVPWVRRRRSSRETSPLKRANFSKRASTNGLCVSLCLSICALLVADFTSPLTIGTIAVFNAWSVGMRKQRSLMKPQLAPAASRSGPSTPGYEAAAGAGDEREESNDVLLGASPKTARSECLPMECPDDFENSSQYGLDLLFGALGKRRMLLHRRESASLDGGRNGRRTSAGSQRDPLRPGLLGWMIGSWGRGVTPPRSSPVPFFPEVHEELTRSWKAPLSARSRYANSPSLTTLDGGAMHLCPQNAASWRGQPKLPSRACKFSSTLVAKAYSASGQAASALHAMAILQVYQAKVLKDLHEGVPDPELVQELRSATDYALRATKVTAQALGRAMSTMVVQERHLWLNLAEMRDAEKVRFLDAPISQAEADGGHQAHPASACGELQPSSAEAATPACSAPREAAYESSSGPATCRSCSCTRPAVQLVGRWHRQLVLRPLRTLARLRSGPETGRPGRRDRLTCPDPHLTRGRALDSASNRLSAPGQTATTWSIKEQFLPSLGVTHSTSDPLLDGRVLCPPSRTCGHTPTVFPHVLKHRACSDDFPSRGNPLVSSHGTNLLGVAASGSQGFLSPATHCPPSHTTPIPGASGVTPLRPLAENISGWLNIPNVSRWLLRTIRLGYAIQFARRPPKFRGVLATSVRGSSATVLRAEIAVLLAKGAIETVPSAEMRKGFYSPYFIVPKKGGGLRPILDLRILNRTLHKRPFKMLTLKHLFTCVRAQDWFVAIDLKDAYFHVSILPRHRPFLRFAFEGRAYQYRVLPFGLSLSPLIFTKIAEAALTPLREMGIRVCNYLDDWLILAHSLELVCTHREVVLNHLAQLGLRVNWEKSKLSPVQRISFLGVELDSISMSARLSPERAQSVLRCAATLRCRSMVPLKQVQRLLGHMASAAVVTPLGLMHMRPLQHWLHTRVPRWAWRRGTLRVGITPSCRKTLSPWTDLAFLRSGVPLEQVSRRIVVTTDASKTGWGAVCNGQAASGVWTGPRLLWHINCLELLAVLLALKRFRPLVQGKHVLVRSDNTATVANINHQGGVRSFRMSRLARHLWLWSQHRLRSLRATHIPGKANRVADSLSRQVSLGGEWRLHPQAVQLIWDRFGQAQVDLFASPESTHCQLWYGLSEAPLGIDALAHSWPKNRLKYAFPPNLVLRPGAPGISPSLAHSPEEGPPLSGEGHNLAPAPRSLEPPSMVPGCDQVDFRDLSPSVVNTLLQARAPSTRRLYDLKWRIFVNWCSSRGEDPRRCGVKSVLSFLQGGLDRHLSASTLKVHVAATSANHDLMGGQIGGETRFDNQISERSPETEPSPAASDPLLGSRCDGAPDCAHFCQKSGRSPSPLRQQCVPRIRTGRLSRCPETPAWIRAQGPHHSLQRSGGDLASHLFPGDDPNLTLSCPVRALRIYLERTQPFRRSEQLFVCYGGQQKGKAVSKQRISHWLVDAIRMAYEARGLPCPLGIRAHSTRGVAASAALANGASLTDICRAAVAPQAAPCVYFPPIAHYGAVFPLRSGCDLHSASFPRETVTSPTSTKTLSRSTETGPASGHCCNRSVLGRWKVTKRGPLSVVHYSTQLGVYDR
ncbi:ORF V: Enzymatic polyprotein [Labeo rohita]|uniref:ribonuclease H n=1 Tax=Labeo rohita TaxID=84645 RepID=A0ABQ8LVH4_LABRO|nr:ORF V: Enzymatic polyprotein [Labeo rohita]